MKIVRFLSSFLKRRSGAAAVEFALVAPILATIATVGWNVWVGEGAYEQAKTALRAGAEYYTAGGTNDTTAQSVAQTAMPAALTNASVTTARACYCAGTVTDCSTPCSAGQERTVYITLTANWTGQGVFQNQAQSQQETVRVQ